MSSWNRYVTKLFEYILTFIIYFYGWKKLKSFNELELGSNKKWNSLKKFRWNALIRYTCFVNIFLSIKSNKWLIC